MRFLQIAGVLGCIVLLSSNARATETVTYTYDARGRITQISYPNNAAITFTYDDSNNLVTTTTTCSGTC